MTHIRVPLIRSTRGSLRTPHPPTKKLARNSTVESEKAVSTSLSWVRRNTTAAFVEIAQSTAEKLMLLAFPLCSLWRNGNNSTSARGATDFIFLTEQYENEKGGTLFRREAYRVCVTW